MTPEEEKEYDKLFKIVKQYSISIWNGRCKGIYDKDPFQKRQNEIRLNELSKIKVEHLKKQL